jgi:hypothetical protein
VTERTKYNISFLYQLVSRVPLSDTCFVRSSNQCEVIAVCLGGHSKVAARDVDRTADSSGRSS